MAHKNALKYLILFPLLLTGCDKGIESLPHEVKPKDVKASTYGEKYKKIREISLIGDGYFRNGFDLCGRTNSSEYEGLLNPLDYNGNAEKDCVQTETRFKDTYYWTFGQWWTANSLDKATYSYNDFSHTYTDASHLIKFNTNNGSFTLGLNAYQEYQTEYGKQILKNGNWTHLLLEQWFPKSLHTKVKDELEQNHEYHLKMDVTLDKLNWYGDSNPKEGQAVQLLMTFILGNPDGDQSDWMWFQMPIFDSRYNTIPDYHAGDSGQPGASNMYVYGIHSKNYMCKNQLKVNQTHCFDFNFSSYIKPAYDEARQKGYLKNVEYKDLKLWYLNFGFEMPNAGAPNCGYDAQFTIDNLDVYLQK